MISVSTPFATANAKLAKQPIYILQIKNYHYAFVTSRTALSAYSYILNSKTASGQPFALLAHMGLCGAFTDSSGNVIQVVSIGAAPTTLVVPMGATQLQLGINDTQPSDNSGSFSVLVNGVLVTVLGTAQPWNWVNGGLNTAYQFGVNSGTSPTIAATGLVAGQIVDVAYQSGTVCDGLFQPNVDADGYAFVDIAGASHPYTADLLDFAYSNPTTGLSGVAFPSIYMGVSLKPWIVDIADLKITVSDLDGSANLADLVVTVQDRTQAITADFPTYVFEGQRAVLLAGFAGMAWEDFAVLFSGVLDTVDAGNGNTEYVFTASDINLKKLTQVIYTTGDDGFPIASAHPKTLNGHPLDMLVSALQQAGVPLTSIDTAKIYYYRDTIFNGLSYLFTLTSAPACKDFIENELMKPLGMYLWENNLGLLSVNSFYPAISGSGSYTPPTPPVATVDTTNTVAIPLETEADLIDQVTFRFDESSSGGSQFLAESTQNWSAGITKYGLYGAHIIESKGMRSGFQGYFMAAIISRLIFLRYGNKQQVLDPVSLFWSACVLEPGDIIALTNPYLPDRVAGVLGETAQIFEVMDRNWKFMEGVVEVKLLAINLSQFKQYLITPNAEPNYAADTSANQAKYMYLSDATGKYSTGAAGNTLG